MNAINWKEEITRMAQNCGFTTADLFDLTGNKARAYLEAHGFIVVESGCKPTHAFARTSEGIYLSSNGYLSMESNNA